MKSFLSIVGTIALIAFCFTIHPYLGIFMLCSVLLYVFS